jgi:hypothetical protein
MYALLAMVFAYVPATATVRQFGDPEQLHKYSSILLKQMLSNGWQLQFIHVEMLAGQGKSLRLGVSRCVSVMCVDWSWM